MKMHAVLDWEKQALTRIQTEMNGVLCVCVCAHACVRVCVCAYVRVCMCTCVRACVARRSLLLCFSKLRAVGRQLFSAAGGLCTELRLSAFVCVCLQFSPH